MEKYEGDFGCQMSEDTKCHRVATKVFREPYTPQNFAVMVCDEHSGHCTGFGYSFDAEATAELLADIEQEEKYFESEDYQYQKSYDAYEAAQLQRLDEIMDGD